MVVFDTQSLTYMMAVTVTTTTYGTPSAKYSVGTQSQGERGLVIFVAISVDCGDFGSGKIMGEDVAVRESAVGHHGGADLAEAHAVTPAGAFEYPS